MHRIVPVIAFAIVALAARSALAQPAETPSGGRMPLAIEELAVRLAPYVATAADLPEGVRLGDLSVETPATLAPAVTPPGGDPRAVFAAIGQELVLRIVRTTTSPPDGPPNFAISVQLMTDADAAHVRRPPAAEAYALRDALACAGLPHEPVVYPGGPHTWTAADRADADARAIVFLRDHLAGPP